MSHSIGALNGFQQIALSKLRCPALNISGSLIHNPPL